MTAPARGGNVAPRLAPLAGVAVDGDGFVAENREPWLEIVGLDLSRHAGRFVEISYRLGLIDQPMRPIFRFIREAGTSVDCIAAAPIVGAGLWIGRVPAGTLRIAVSPTAEPGPFAFRIEEVRRRSWVGLVAEGLRRRPRQARSAVLTRLIGWAPESDSNLAWATGAFALATHAAWSRRRVRVPERDGLDRPRGGDRSAPPVLVMRAGDADTATIASLRAQIVPDWRLLVVGAPRSSDDGRIRHLDAAGACGELASLPGNSLVAFVRSGDTLPPYAIAFLAEQQRRHPDVALFYGDETIDGALALKPGWSPRLMAALPYLGRAYFVRVGGWDAAERARFVDRGTPPARCIADAAAVYPLRRVLLHRPDSVRSPQPAAQPARRGIAARAAIIIPTCDQPRLLRRVVASIRRRSVPGSYRLVIVDNGRAVGGEERAHIAELAHADDAVVLRRDDAFNFSSFCNDAVAACDEPLLVFLNDDTEVLDDGWLDSLAALALQPDVGAVGARLTYPDGRLQHVGVLIGMGGSAGHFGAPAAGDDPGWLGRNTVPHEVSAVTGACLALARDKFLAVGGFDAEALPVELSDIDLCLKLNERGWQTMVDPAVHLLHEESASRGGATFRRLNKYSVQREVFVERWRHVLRDDPFSHPGLSLYSLAAALG